ncbi:hypothetical protein QR680_001777 [Steinernema hermaphroditum]|uniref:SOCS box domain-containing protein n=1 Tax=Steinernema hermaphroditum TaxID=289476 RepID=A0AA39LGP5_9BILA|nr:hypothetical protein QR680_001777 [Steinernema hermaphroditum]
MSLLMSASSYGEGQCSTCMGAHHEFQLKFLLVGDSDVGKNEILDMLPSENQPKDSPLPYIAAPKTTTILLEGKRVRLHLWDTSGQGRFSTIIRSYSRGAEGLLIVYDITNRWSFEGIKRWLVEIDEHAPGIPRILIGNRLHLEFKRAIPRKEVESFAAKRNMEYFEVSTLAFFNVKESLTELARLVISRNGMHHLWRCNRVPSLQELSCRSVVKQLETVHAIDRLPLPVSLKHELRSFARGAQCYTYTVPKVRRKPVRLTLSEMSPRQIANRTGINVDKDYHIREREGRRAKGCILM